MLRSHERSRSISKDSKAFDDCVILSRDAFDPDAVFLDDIVDDDVLPYLSLEVEGLTTAREGRKGQLELRPEDVLQRVLEVPHRLYGWESSLWKKIRGYLGL